MKDLLFTTPKLEIYIGRKLKLRIHLGAYFLTLSSGYESILGFNLRQFMRKRYQENLGQISGCA
jgi:hypothetical protein